jgi:hypothetical protein
MGPNPLLPAVSDVLWTVAIVGLTGLVALVCAAAAVALVFTVRRGARREHR